MIWATNSYATVAADKVSSPIQHEIKRTCFVSQSTTIRIVLHLLTTGRLVTKSKLQEWNHSGGIGNGYNALGGGYIESLFLVQTSHDLQYAVMSYHIFGH